jgi:hypothetical protein
MPIMPTHKSARELLEHLFDKHTPQREDCPICKKDGKVDTALAQLAELVRSQKNGYDMVWDKACEHIAQKFGGEEMSREIRFRAWDIDLKKMFSGAFSVNASDGGVIDAGWNKGDGKSGCHCIALQFTGLLDKNGKEVYEGDIVKVLDDDGDEISEDTIVYNAPSFEFMPDNSLAIDGRIVEVIGNIYENPELLRSPK